MNRPQLDNSCECELPDIAQQSLTAIDLFAGAGGFSLAARNLGIQLRAAVEYDKWAQETYRHNFIEGCSNPPLLYGDITDIQPEELLMELGMASRDLDLLMGGPPCQGFSTHRIKGAGVDDPRNNLLLRYFDFVKILQPKAFIVENVPGILWPRHESYLNTFYRLAKKQGYQVFDPIRVNARDFGVPQNRQRVFILGVRSGISLPDNFQWPPNPTHYDPDSDEVVKDGRASWLPAKVVFDSPIPSKDKNAMHMNPSPMMVKRFKETKPNGGSRSDWSEKLECHKGHNGHKDVYGRIDPSKPGPTMTTGCINPSRGRFVHPTEHHGITARHAARFQTFPESFVFLGGLGHAGKQIGNAVPVKLGEAILGQLLNLLGDKK